MTPKVSVIVPIYNVEPYLQQCIDSIRRQTVHEIEILLIDDGSPDMCPKMCDRFACEDERIRVFHQPNAGVSAARNLGINMAVGEWIMFVDPDDWLEHNAVAVLYECAVSKNCDIVCATHYSNYELCRCGQEEIKKTNQAGEYNVREHQEFFLKLLYKQQPGDADFWVPWGKLYRREHIVDTQCFFMEELKKSEDKLFNLKAVLCAENVVIIDTPVSHYRIRANSASRRLSPNLAAMNRLYTDSICKFMKEHFLWDQYSDYYYFEVVNLCILDCYKLYSMNIHTLKDFFSTLSYLKKFFCGMEYEKAIKTTTISDAYGKSGKLGLWFLKHRMYGICLFMYYLRNKVRL